jgi:hypothetical protein
MVCYPLQDTARRHLYEIDKAAHRHGPPFRLPHKTHLDTARRHAPRRGEMLSYSARRGVGELAAVHKVRLKLSVYLRA